MYVFLNDKYRYRRYWPCIYSVSDRYQNLQYRTPLGVAQFFKISFNRVTVNRFEQRNKVLLCTARVDCKCKNKTGKENAVLINLLASTPHFGILGHTVEKRRTKLKIITGADFSVLHTQFRCLSKEDPLDFTIHHPELIILKKIKRYRD